MANEKTRAGIRNWSRLLGYAGLIPFFGLTLIAVIDIEPASSISARLLLTYGAIILSFVGAVHWGYALDHPKATGDFTVFSIVPATVAWFSLMLPIAYAYGVLCVAFAGWFFYETNSNIGRHFPVWYKELRLHLTAGACLTLVLAAMRAGGSV